MKFIHVTDMHIVPSGERLHGLDPLERLEACIADINAQHGDAAFCVFTGDLVHCGEPEAYMVLRDALANLSLPYRLLLGNHDDRDNFLSVFPETESDENGFVQSIMRTPAGYFIFADTLDSRIPETDAGCYCDRRRAWLSARLAEARGQPVYLFMHHPPFDIGIPCLDRIRLEDPARFADTIDGFDNIRHVFFGHVHRPVSGCWRGIPFSAMRGTNHQVPLDFKTVSPVPKSHEPPAYGVVFLEADRTVVHVHDYLDDRRLIDLGDGSWSAP